MRRNRKNSIKKERIVMIASSAFVLAALTMTGVYMKEKNVESQDDGYTVDFAALEKDVEEKYQEIAQIETPVQENAVTEQTNMENDLDYMPLEVDSGLVEIEGLTEGLYSLEEIAEDVNSQVSEMAEDLTGEIAEEISEEVKEVPQLSFSEEDALIRPTAGEVLLPYSMEGSIYFETLDQYKYNPAMIFAAEEGSVVGASAEGKIVKIFDDPQIGKAVTVDLGDGYQITYGQLKDIQVSVDSYVNVGDVLGKVAAPTKYYSVEGTNLYFAMTKDGEPVNPETFF